MTSHLAIFVVFLYLLEVLNAMVVLHANYPQQPPLILLSLKADQHARVNANADVKVRYMETNIKIIS